MYVCLPCLSSVCLLGLISETAGLILIGLSLSDSSVAHGNLARKQ